MAVMHPATCPDSANAGERAVFAAMAQFLDESWTAWVQTPLPGRSGGGRRTPVPLRADLVLLGPAGLYVVEVKGWRPASIADADDSVVTFQNGARVQHPLVQAYRYAVGLLALLRAQPGVLRGAAVPVRYAAALPYFPAAVLAAAPWAPAFHGPRLLVAEDLSLGLGPRLAALPPPAPAPLSPAQQAAICRLFTRTGGRVPSAHPPSLFDDL